MLDATEIHTQRSALATARIESRIGHTRATINEAITAISNQSHGGHPTGGTLEADALNLLVSLVWADGEDKACIADDLADVAGQLRDRIDSDLAGVV